MVSTPKTIVKSAAKPAKNGRSAQAVALAKRASAPVAKPKTPAPATANPAAIKSASAASSSSVAQQAEALVPSGQTSNANALKKKDLIDRVVASTGAKKKLVKDIVEATLTVLGDALSKGDTLNIPPFGKAKVSRPQEAGTRNAMTVKLRRTSGGGQGGGQGKAKSSQMLADAEE